jgi:hypothetical protein
VGPHSYELTAQDLTRNEYIEGLYIPIPGNYCMTIQRMVRRASQPSPEIVLSTNRILLPRLRPRRSIEQYAVAFQDTQDSPYVNQWLPTLTLDLVLIHV